MVNALAALCIALFVARGWEKEKQKITSSHCQKTPRLYGAFHSPAGDRRSKAAEGDMHDDLTTLDLTILSDEKLKQLIADGRAELARREKKRKQEAAARIKTLAEAAGLAVTVKDKVQKRRGRPPKNRDQ
jgi:hypothetical protein